MVKKISINLIKILFWAIPIYLISIILAIVSGYFTFKFYSDGTTGYDLYVMGGLAISLELIKFILSSAYPAIKGRVKSVENTVLTVMKIALVLSILASLYYLLLGKDVTLSPASKTIAMLYNFIPIMDIVPLKFSQFLGTISLSILIEFFIVWLPTIVPTMFIQKGTIVKTNLNNLSNMDKVRTIINTIPNRILDNLYKKITNAETLSQTNKQPDKKIRTKYIAKLSKGDKNKTILDLRKYVQDKQEEIKKGVIQDTTNLSDENIVQDKQEEDKFDVVCELKEPITSIAGVDKVSKANFDKNVDEKRLLKTIYKNKKGDICPSIVTLITESHLNKDKIRELKKKFINLGIIETQGKQTFVKVEDYTTALKRLEGGGVRYKGE
jgi:hypothetical protein